MLNILCAYPYIGKDVIDRITQYKYDLRLLVDSGAFTAWKAGQEIKLDDYCRFIESLPFKPWRYFSLDVIGDPHATMKNYELMLKRGFNPIPVFTRGEDVSVIKDFYQTSDVVGIGGLVGTRGNKGFVKGIMSHIGQRKCHWLGFTSMPFVKYYRPYSCDSSSWESGGRYGMASLFCYRTAEMVRIDKELFDKNRQRFISLCQSNGLDIYCNKTMWSGGHSMIRFAGAYGYVNMSLELEKTLGTKMFLAFAVKGALDILLDVYCHRVKGEKHRKLTGN